MMKMTNILRKLSSRKLWVALAGITTGIALILGVDGSEISNVAGGVISLISAIVYIYTEGKIDAESVKNTIEKTQSAIESIEKTI
jgi:hypothetical protein